MAGNESKPGTNGGRTEGEVNDFEEEEYTSPGIDPKLAKAMESLKRTQSSTIIRVSDITELLKKQKSEPPKK
jgi:hypothetical protein